MKEIIEADPMKEVLHLRATYGPRRETMKEIIEVDTDPKKEVLRLRPTFQAASFDHYSTSDRSKL